MAENNPFSGMNVKLTVAEAIRLTTNWREYLKSSGQDFQVRGFLLPVESIRALLDTNPEAEGIRAYIGLENVNDPANANLVLVPVVGGEDIIFIPGSAQRGANEDDSNVYDRSSPCPPLCGPSSDLNP